MDFGKENIGKAVINILMLQPFFPDRVYDFNGLSWYLSATIFMYIIGYFLIKLTKRIKKYLPVAFLIVIVIMVALNILLRLGYDLYIYSNPIYRIFDCFLGMMVAEVFMTRKLLKNDSVATKAEIILAFIFIIMYFISIKITANPAYYTIFFCIAMYVFANGKGMISRILGNKLFICTVDFSFYFYMTHELVLRTIRLYVPDSMNYYLRLLLITVFAFIITCVISYLCKRIANIKQRAIR